jgi:hypothetical protein
MADCNNYDDGHHEEESAIFRSIPLGVSAPSLEPLRFGPPPKLGAKRSRAAPLPAQTSKAEPASWRVDASSIPRVPDYPLEVTSVSLDKQLSLDEITSRIARVLEAQNLICCYGDEMEDDEERLPGRVDCTSENKELKFIVQLWRNHEDQIVVEMQRRRGCSVEFSAIRRPLFQTLMTGETPKFERFTPPPFVPNKKLKFPPPLRR